ncbi:MAG TPA: DUF1801 domain-containing protein [Devosiaceae bacterium]
MAGTKPAAKPGKSGTFSAEERAAMKEAAEERKAEARRKKTGGKVDGEADLLAKVAAMPEPDRELAERIHAIVKANAPHLQPKTWYGMPAYANAEGKVVCFFQNASKFKARYATLGFNDAAALDDGNMWPTTFALTRLTADEETRIAALVRKAAG